MISLVLGMLRARRGQAAVLGLLAMFAVAAAVAAPAYLRAVDQAVVASEVAAAGAPERGLTVSSTVDNRSGGSDLNFVNVGAALIGLPTFTQVSASEYPVLGLETSPHVSSRLAFRQDACAHLVMVRGRCLIGAGEVVVGQDTAQRLNLRPGSVVSLSFAAISTDPRTPWYLPDGFASQLAIVGVYRTAAPDDTYWGTRGYFTVGADGRPSEPVFTNAATMSQMDHGATLMSIDATPTAETFTVDRLGGLRADLNALNITMAKLGPSVTVHTGIPALLNRIDNGRTLAHRSVPVAAVPLVMLACFVVFLAVSYSVDGRRPELAVVSLRGTRWWVRWGLAVGESLVPILAGAVVGCLVGQVLVGLLVLGRIPDLGAAVFTVDSLRYAPVATLGAALAAVAAQRRPLRSTVVELLRLIPSHPPGWRLAVVEVVGCLLAVVATAQLWLSHGSLLGVGMAAPALVISTVALIGSRALVPVASRYGRRAMRRGRLTAALAAFSLARRPGIRRLFALLTGAVAILGFAACAVDVAAQDRAIAARVGNGAARVLSIGDVSRQQLLHAVRAVDPEGRYAMAVAQVPPEAPGGVPKLAVDSRALGAVATWSPDFGPVDAAAVARALRPDALDPVVVQGQDVDLSVDVTGADVKLPVSLTVVLSPLSGPGTVLVQFGVLHNGPYSYQQRAPECVNGCRLVGLHLKAEGTSGMTLRLSVTLHSLGTVNPTRVATHFVGDDQRGTVAAVTRWRIPAGGSLTAQPNGLRVDIDAPDGLPDGAWLQPTDAPYPLPVVSTATLPSDATMAGLDGRRIPIILAGRVRGLPRLGADGSIVDLEYADRLATDVGTAVGPEVWLGPSAPSDVVSRLSQQGLVIADDVGVDAVRRNLDAQGPALALRFHLLVGCLAIVLAAGGLALVAAVDRRPRAAELSALRAQGVGYRTVRATLLWGYPALAVAGGVVGLATALVAWWLTGWALPIFSTPQPALDLPIFPRPLAVLLPWAAAVAVLTAVAAFVGRDLRRLLRRTQPPGR